MSYVSLNQDCNLTRLFNQYIFNQQLNETN
jgi:hypothetical protein